LNHEESQESAEDITLLILERGAEWPSWGTGIRMRAHNSAVEVQADGEDSEDFHNRVQGRIQRIREKGQKLKAAGYACALEGPVRRTSRKQLCSELLMTLDGSDRTELILAGGSWDTSGEEALERAQLIEIWSELSQAVPGRVMSVRFEDPPTESGVFRAAEKLRDSRPLNEQVTSDDSPEPPGTQARR